jgi:hypothetical protein
MPARLLSADLHPLEQLADRIRDAASGPAISWLDEAIREAADELRGLDTEADAPPDPRGPCQEAPGTPGKVAVIMDRLARGCQACHPDDPTDQARAAPREAARNGRLIRAG